MDSLAQQKVTSTMIRSPPQPPPPQTNQGKPGRLAGNTYRYFIIPIYIYICVYIVLMYVYIYIYIYKRCLMLCMHKNMYMFMSLFLSVFPLSFLFSLSLSPLSLSLSPFLWHPALPCAYLHGYLPVCVSILFACVKSLDGTLEIKGLNSLHHVYVCIYICIYIYEYIYTHMFRSKSLSSTNRMAGSS